MDGVLVDLASNIERILNTPIDNIFNRHSTEYNPEVLENLIDLYFRDTEIEVFGTAEKMNDADVLWDFLSKHQVEILSSTGPWFKKRIEQEKINWVRKHLCTEITVNLVAESHIKADYATEYSILIDDQYRSIEPWRQSGGIGIIHTDATTTIIELKKLGF